MFLREPFDRLHDSYRPQAQYLTHMREVGISNSLFEQPLEIVGDSYMSIIVRPKNRFAKINFEVQARVLKLVSKKWNH